MVIRLDENYNAMTSTALLGYVGETNARPVSVEGLTVDGADRYVLTIDYGDGVTYEVDITGGTWTPTADILRSAQTVSCQICAKKLLGDEYILVKKSRIFRLRIGAAIGDTAVPSPDVAMDALDRIDAIGRQAHADMQTAQSAAETATTAAENAKKSATNAGLSADTATQAASRAETAKTAAETSATQAETAMQGAETARAEAVTAQNAAKVSADQASVSAQQTTADKNITAGYAKTAKTCADSTAADRQAVQTLAEQVTVDKATVAENAAKVAEDRTAAETAAQTAQAVADSLPDDYTTAVEKIAENTAEINNTNTEVSELKGDISTLLDYEVIHTIDENYTGFDKREKSYCDLSGIISNDLWDCFAIKFDSEKQFYVENYDANQFIVCIFPKGVIPTSYDSSGIRYRSQESNLPTVNNKATIPAGSIVVFEYQRLTSSSVCHFTIGIDISTGETKLKEKLVEKANLSTYIQNVIDKEYSETVLTVGNGKQFSTIKDALEACENPSKNNRYLIEFYGDGAEYDLTEETALWNQEHEAIGLMIPNYTTLKGVGGKDKCILTLRLDVSSTVISALNIRGTSNLEGLTIIGNNCRYVVHDDYETVGDEIIKERHIKNCDFIGENLTYGTTWGAGCRSGNIWYFENCRFISKADDGFPFTCHNNKRFTAPARLFFINCRAVIPSNHKGFGFGTLSNDANNIINELYFYGCKTNRISFYEQEPATYGNGMLFKLSGYSNDLKDSDVVLTTPDSAVSGNKIVISRSNNVDYTSYVDMI